MRTRLRIIMSYFQAYNEQSTLKFTTRNLSTFERIADTVSMQRLRSIFSTVQQVCLTKSIFHK